MARGKESQTGASVEAHILVHASHVPTTGGRALDAAALCVRFSSLSLLCEKWGNGDIHFGIEFISAAGCEANPSLHDEMTE